MSLVYHTSGFDASVPKDLLCLVDTDQHFGCHGLLPHWDKDRGVVVATVDAIVFSNPPAVDRVILHKPRLRHVTHESALRLLPVLPLHCKPNDDGVVRVAVHVTIVPHTDGESKSEHDSKVVEQVVDLVQVRPVWKIARHGLKRPDVRWQDRGPVLSDVARAGEARWQVERPVDMAGKSESEIRDQIRNLIAEMAIESGLELVPNETLARMGV